MTSSRGPADGGPGRAEGAEGPRTLTHRKALAVTAAATGAVVGARVLPAWAGHDPTTRRPTPDRPPPSDELMTYEEVILAFRNHGFHLEMFREPITPLGSHYLLIHFDIPKLDAEGYSIALGGRVARPGTLTLAELKQRPNVKRAAIMECAGVGRSYSHPRAIYVPWFNEPIGCFEYTATPLGPLLEEAGILDDAVEVVFTGHDNGVDLGKRHNFERALPIDEAIDPANGVMLAWEHNGQALLPSHGGDGQRDRRRSPRQRLRHGRHAVARLSDTQPLPRDARQQRMLAARCRPGALRGRVRHQVRADRRQGLRHLHQRQGRRNGPLGRGRQGRKRVRHRLDEFPQLSASAPDAGLRWVHRCVRHAAGAHR